MIKKQSFTAFGRKRVTVQSNGLRFYYKKYIGMVKKLFLALFVLFVILWISNPTYESFKSQHKRNLLMGEKAEYTRIINFLVYSIYESKIVRPDEDWKMVEADNETYLGVAGNFFLISKQPGEKYIR